MNEKNSVRFTRSVRGAFVCVMLFAGPSVASLLSQRVAVTSTSTANREADILLTRIVAVDLDRVTLEQALRAVAASARIQIQYRAEVLNSYATPVTLHAKQIPLGAALTQILVGTPFQAVLKDGMRVSVVEIPQTEQLHRAGTITGNVRDAQTKRAIVGASVVVDGAAKGVMTGDDGSFRMAGIAAGPHTVAIKYIGYVRVVRTITVTDDVVTTVDVTLQPSASVLDQVVVTGTVIPTERRGVPNAMTVISAQEIERRGITHIDQLFRGDVPGVVAVNVGTSNGYNYGGAAIFARGSSGLVQSPISEGIAALQHQSPSIKTYIDGVELREPSLLSLIDARSIDHIEVIPGPQASTIYGSGASTGVLQIFTKHGQVGDRPRVTAGLQYGMIQNNYSSSRAPRHDDNLMVEGSAEATMYAVGGSYTYVGQWVPARLERSVAGYGSVRHTEGPVTVTASVRELQRTGQGGGLNGAIVAGWKEGTYVKLFNDRYNIPDNLNYLTPQQTLGLTADVRVRSWWVQTLTLGDDRTDATRVARRPRFSSSSDSLLFYAPKPGHQSAETYNTTFTLPTIGVVHGAFVAGADHKRDEFSYLGVSTSTLLGSLTGSPFLGRADTWTNGEFMQAQVGLGDMLTLTAGVRWEQSSGFGDNAGSVSSPRIGLSLVRDVSSALTIKIRGAYGEATTPPAQESRGGSVGTDPMYPFHYVQVPNFSLLPEQQRGGEGGVELYWGRLLSLSITRYDQLVRNGIYRINPVDSTRSYVPQPVGSCGSGRGQDAAGYCYDRMQEYVNVGRIKNDGWEGAGSVTWGPWTGRGTWSMTRSRVKRSSAPSGVPLSPQAINLLLAKFPPGQQLKFGPEHSGGASLGYAHGPTTVTFALSAVSGGIIDAETRASGALFWARLLKQSEQRATDVAGDAGWLIPASGYATVDLFATQAVTSALSVTFQVQNIADRYHTEVYGSNPTQGRVTSAGIRLRW